jgi:Domain of unknown function (DUF4410)
LNPSIDRLFISPTVQPVGSLYETHKAKLKFVTTLFGRLALLNLPVKKRRSIMRKMSSVLSLIICAAAIALTTGCATTLPKPTFTKPIAPSSQISAKDGANVKIEAGAGVTMLESEKVRVAEKIKQHVDIRKITNKPSASAKTYEIRLVITKYEKGNMLARLMLAGLGQIHIDADVAVFEMSGQIPVGNFSLSKTFAWGGIYGVTTDMEDIETVFADGVAAALTGQKDE